MYRTCTYQDMLLWAAFRTCIHCSANTIHLVHFESERILKESEHLVCTSKVQRLSTSQCVDLKEREGEEIGMRNAA